MPAILCPARRQVNARACCGCARNIAFWQTKSAIKIDSIRFVESR